MGDMASVTPFTRPPKMLFLRILMISMDIHGASKIDFRFTLLEKTTRDARFALFMANKVAAVLGR